MTEKKNYELQQSKLLSRSLNGGRSKSSTFKKTKNIKENKAADFKFEEPEVATQAEAPINNYEETKFVLYDEAEINRRVEAFTKKMNKQLLDKLNEERKKEEEREILILKTEDEKERKRLQKILSMERAQSSETIILLNK